MLALKLEYFSVATECLTVFLVNYTMDSFIENKCDLLAVLLTICLKLCRDKDVVFQDLLRQPVNNFTETNLANLTEKLFINNHIHKILFFLRSCQACRYHCNPVHLIVTG